MQVNPNDTIYFVFNGTSKIRKAKVLSISGFRIFVEYPNWDRKYLDPRHIIIFNHIDKLLYL